MIEVFMPKAGMDMKEGRLIRWLKNVGDHVELNEPIMEIETDKINMEAESPGSGVLLAKLVEAGAVVPVLQTIGYVGEPGEKIPESKDEKASGVEPEKKAEEKAEAPKIEKKEGEPAATPYARTLARKNNIKLSEIPGAFERRLTAKDVEDAIAKAKEEAEANAREDKIKATPLAEKYAKELGVDLADVKGSGDGGKIRKSDVVSASEKGGKDDFPEPIHVPLSTIRKTIARNMFESLRGMAQTSVSAEVDVTNLMALRRRLAEKADLLGTKITVNDLLGFAVVKMLKNHPWANASYTDDEIITYPYVNLNIAVATDYGLVTPVVARADKMSLVEFSKKAKDSVERARRRELTLADLSGGTFTITNMGIFPVDNFNPILPLPQSCIAGFGRCVEKPVVVNGEICVRSRMVISLTYDHRILDGSEAGSIMADLKEYVENPELFIVQ